MATTDEEKSDYQTIVICDQCEGTKNVNSYCLDCKANICDDCKVKRLHREHQLLPRTDKRVTRARKLAKRHCQKHPGNHYVTFCKQCNDPCCPICISGNHQRHSFCDIEDAATEAKSNLKTYIDTLESETLPIAKGIHSTIIFNIDEYNDSNDKAIKGAKLRYLTLKNELDGAAKQWMARLTDMDADDMAKVNANREDVEKHIQYVEGLKDAAKGYLAEAGDIEILEFARDLPGIKSLQPAESHTPVKAIEFQVSGYTLPTNDELLGMVVRVEKYTTTIPKVLSTSVVGDSTQIKSDTRTKKRNIALSKPESTVDVEECLQAKVYIIV